MEYNTTREPQPLKDKKCPICGSQKFIITESTCWKATSEVSEDDQCDMDAYSAWENNIDEIVCHVCGQEIDQEGLEVNFS